MNRSICMTVRSGETLTLSEPDRGLRQRLRDALGREPTTAEMVAADRDVPSILILRDPLPVPAVKVSV